MDLSLAKAERALDNLVLISFLVPLSGLITLPRDVKSSTVFTGLWFMVRQSGVNCHYFGFGDIYFETSLLCISVENSCF